MIALRKIGNHPGTRTALGQRMEGGVADMSGGPLEDPVLRYHDSLLAKGARYVQGRS